MSLVLGTAGHIDHGKSALVQALTGTDPDRLPEEKERGVTIELGFAELTLPSGAVMGVVDVPGHERFVRQMVAGATGIDVVLLVVAADDGVMPQTREHLAIIDLLGIRRGVVAITKSDLADAAWIDLVREDITRLLTGSSIEGAPIVAVSSRTGEGLDALLVALDEVASAASSRETDLPLRLPVDRVFTIAGAGTVVTGTLWSGRARRDDRIEVLPSGRAGRVRGVQVHSSPVEEAVAGQRVALNLSGVDRDEVERGDVIAAPGTLNVTDRFDALVTYLPGNERAFESGARVHVHHGTSELLARLLLMDDKPELAAGERAYAQLRLERPLAPRYGDHFILRSYSPVFTIGGGVVLDALPPRRTHLSRGERSLLDALADGDLAGAATKLVTARGIPMTAAEVAGALGLEREAVVTDLAGSGLARLAVGGDTYYAALETLERLVSSAESELLAFHRSDPKATGLAAGALRDLVDHRVPARVFDAVLALAEERGLVRLEGGRVRHPDAAVSALAEEDAAVQKLEPLLRAQGLAPAGTVELAASAGVDPAVARRALARLVSEGRAVRLGADLHFSTEAVGAAQERVTGYLREHPTILAAEARDLLGTSRKYVVPLLEHFDAVGLTRRDGDVRALRVK